MRRIAEETAGQLEPDTPVILIDNVADYYHRGTDKRQWDLERDFPCVAPPWPQALFEWRRRTSSGARAAAACHWRTGLAADDDMQAFVSRTLGDDVPEWPDAHWLIFASFYVADATHAVQALPLRAWLPVAKDGSPGTMALEYATPARDALGEGQVRQEVTRLMAVPMLAVTFAHCRNVSERSAPIREAAPCARACRPSDPRVSRARHRADVGCAEGRREHAGWPRAPQAGAAHLPRAFQGLPRERPVRPAPGPVLVGAGGARLG